MLRFLPSAVLAAAVSCVAVAGLAQDRGMFWSRDRGDDRGRDDRDDDRDRDRGDRDDDIIVGDYLV